jgi:hypothetical protein
MRFQDFANLNSEHHIRDYRIPRVNWPSEIRKPSYIGTLAKYLSLFCLLRNEVSRREGKMSEG